MESAEYNRTALLYIDLDHFKPVNDRLGHQAGDTVLRAVGARLAGILRQKDTIARIGGDEFVAILPEVRIQDVTAIADRIIDEIRQPFEVAGQKIEIGASIGIAIMPDNGVTEEDVLNKADIALYRAKSNGRSCYLYYDPALDRRAPIPTE